MPGTTFFFLVKIDYFYYTNKQTVMKKQYLRFTMAVETEIDIETSQELDEAIKELLNNSIILYNDDHNSFEHVIICLMKYCDHIMNQAEQCALIVHNNGKCSVKSGTYDELKPICEALLENGLTAKIQ